MASSRPWTYGRRSRNPLSEDSPLPVRARAFSLLISLFVALLVIGVPAPAPTLAAGEKVVIIVGPVGSLTAT
jgi:hypothetical protein